MHEQEQTFAGILFIPRLLPKRLEGTGPKAIISVALKKAGSLFF